MSGPGRDEHVLRRRWAAAVTAALAMLLGAASARGARSSTVRRRLAAVVALAVTAGATLAVPVRAVPPERTPPPADPTLGPLHSGASSYVGGTYVWTDYAYDDRGPDTNDRPGGDATYPAAMDPNNVADLIQLQLRSTRDGIRTTVVLETLTPATRPVVGIALDSDGDPSTGAASLPGSWTAASGLGVDHLFVLRTAGGEVLAHRDGAWTGVGAFDVSVDPERNTLGAGLPFAIPTGGVLRAVAAVGYEDATGGSWTSGATPVHDLAFVTAESPTVPYLQSVADAITGFAAGGNTLWQDYRQSAILAGQADPAGAVASIDLVKLASGATTLAAPDRKGFHTFLYRSELTLGEGVQGSGNSALFAGPYQPYLVWVPENLRPGLPLVMYLHGSSQTHLSAVNTAQYDPSTQDPVLRVPEGFFDFDAVVAWPLARGPQQGYDGVAERDVLDVTDDVLARLSLDPDRVMLAGLSMGGIGTFRLAQLHPDRWSVAYADVGYDETRLLENLTNVPLRFQNGAADYLVNAALALETRTRVDAAGTVDYRSWLRMNHHHQPAVNQAACVYRESFTRPRVTDPARVRYTVDPAMFVEDPTTGLVLRYTGAYWVGDMVPAGRDRASVDLSSRAFGYEPVPGPTTRAVYDNITSGRDFCGPNPEVRQRDVWDEQARAVERAPHPAEPVLTGTLTGLSAVTIAADRAGVSGAGSRLELSTDHPVALTLTGLPRGTAVEVGDQRARADRSGAATISLPVGGHVVTVQ